MACKKQIEVQDASEHRKVALNTNNNTFSYGGRVFFLSLGTKNQFLLPTQKPGGVGVYKAIPRGLSIDSVTGRVNVSKSLSGMRYKVYFVSPTGILQDSTSFVIAGIDYADSIYVLNATPNHYDMAIPIYNANKNLTLPCQEDDDDSDNLCVFDETDLNNDGNDDIAGVIQQKLLVNQKTGVIDVEGSFHAGIFGTLTPANGTRRDLTFYYRLQDASNMALNKITVRVIYYRRLSDVPRSLTTLISDRKKIDELVLKSPLPGQTSELIDSGTKLDFNYYLKPRRPPNIVIIGQ